MDLRHPYLTEQLIAYIGNKRALLPFLHGVFSRLVEDRSRSAFLDPFAGTGAVSRLARLMGFAVSANDWEPYSFVINSCHLGIGAQEIGSLFRRAGGLDAVLARLNDLPPVAEDRGYISRHYAPRCTETADWRTERLFYTRENAQVIDTLRERIEELYPGSPREEPAFREKMALLAPLLYEAATHTNTSGVFKACHRGFGGHGRDALKRIMTAVRLRAPVLADVPAAASVECMDAARFLAARGADLCYLDPPYAVHQYGSNYFMLNTIALWDKPPVSAERGPDGRLLKKAGIRSDWTRTRSAFCSAATAAAAMREVIAAADCRFLVVSYSNEGLLGLEELCDMLSATGQLTLHHTGYVKYPGGKQSLERTTRNQELALVVDRRAPPSPSAAVGRLLREARIARLMDSSFDPARVREAFSVDGEAIIAGTARLPMRHFWRFRPDAAVPVFGSAVDAERFLAALSGCLLADAARQIDVLREMARRVPDERERDSLLRESLRLLNRLAHRKNAAIFSHALRGLREDAAGLPGREWLRAGLDAAAAKAARRLERP